MSRILVFRMRAVRAFAAVVATNALFCTTVRAESSAFQNAFERRVSGSGSRDALDTYVVEAVREGQYDQAISTLEEVLLNDPNDADARIALARIYYQLGSYGIAAAHLDELDALGVPGRAGEIASLRAMIERGKRGIEARFAVTFGAAYGESTTNIATLPPTTDQREVFTPFVLIDGEVVRLLDTASRDEIRLGGALQYEQSVADTNFDGMLDTFDAVGGRVEVTYSKGLPDIIDTLRLDVSGYGLIQDFGGGRKLQDYGGEAELSVRPTVESRISVFAGYGWLGNSAGLYGTDRFRYGVSGEVRVAPALTLYADATGYQEQGTAPVAFAGGSPGYTANGYQLSAAAKHLLFVFSDGRSWIHEIGARYSEERILDHASVAGPFPFQADMVDRAAWEVFWAHVVQVATQAEVNLGVTYGQEDFTDTDLFSTADRRNEYWTVKTGLTFRFN